MKNSSKIIFIIVGLFLGFSPITEPHIIGKIQWVAGGAVGMKLVHWFDLVLHGSGIIIAILLTISMIFPALKKKK